MKNNKPAIFILVMGLVLTLFFVFDLKSWLSLEQLKLQQTHLLAYTSQNPFMSILIYSIVYVAITALSLPGAAVLTLLGGALFGLVKGTLIVSITSTTGATLAFLFSRFFLREWTEKKLGSQLERINQGIEQEGPFYLFSLRLIPIIPFFVINLAMGLTQLSPLHFFFVSQIGMLPGTIVYVNAGTELAKIESLKGLASPSLIFAFILLGLFPLVAKKLLSFFTNKKGSSNA